MTSSSPNIYGEPTNSQRTVVAILISIIQLQMMVHRLADMVVVLTGGSSGIGASIAQHLLKEVSSSSEHCKNWVVVMQVVDSNLQTYIMFVMICQFAMVVDYVLLDLLSSSLFS